MSELIDAQDEISRAKHLAQVVIMACADLEDTSGNAIATTCGALLKHLEDAMAKIEAYDRREQAPV